MPKKHDQALKCLQLFVKTLLLTNVIDHLIELGIVLTDHSDEILLKFSVKLVGEGLGGNCELFELGIDDSNGLDVCVFDEIQVGFLVLGLSFLDLLLQETVVVFDLVLIKADKSLGGKMTVFQGFDDFEKVFEQNNQEHALLFGGQKVAIDMLDHIVNKLAVIKVGQEDGVVVVNIVLLGGGILYVIAVSVSKEILC